MKHIQEANPFQAGERFPGASAAIRRALAQSNFESAQCKRILAACKALKLKTVSPFYDADNWAHIGIPSKRVVIFVNSCGARERIDVKREGWTKAGFEMLAVTYTGVDRLLDEALVRHLGDALRGVAK
jgi:hypothetical protein